MASPVRLAAAGFLGSENSRMQVANRAGGVFRVWHTGTDSSVSVPQLGSHASTSSALVCTRVRWNSSHAWSVACRNAPSLSSRSMYCSLASRIIQWGVKGAVNVPFATVPARATGAAAARAAHRRGRPQRPDRSGHQLCAVDPGLQRARLAIRHDGLKQESRLDRTQQALPGRSEGLSDRTGQIGAQVPAPTHSAGTGCQQPVPAAL